MLLIDNQDDLIFKLLGDSNVGKTSFLKRYLKNQFSNNYLATIGLDIERKQVKVANYIYKITTYDTYGEERFKCLPKKYYQNLDGAFLLFDVIDELSFKNVYLWMKELEENNNDSKYIVYLIGNKIDKPNRVIQRETAEALAKSLGIKYFEVSCKINMNIPEDLARMIMECTVGDDYRFIKNYRHFYKFISPLIKVCTEIDSKVNGLYSNTLVIQKIINELEIPIELKIYVKKNTKCIFSSFSAQIGDSIKVKSKVIQKEKAKIKYIDSISSRNATIFVSDDPTNENRIIINMGNIPPKQEVTFISNFIQFIDSSNNYEFELFRNLPICVGGNSIYKYDLIKGQVEIKTKIILLKLIKK